MDFNHESIHNFGVLGRLSYKIIREFNILGSTASVNFKFMEVYDLNLLLLNNLPCSSISEIHKLTLQFYIIMSLSTKQPTNCTQYKFCYYMNCSI